MPKCTETAVSGTPEKSLLFPANYSASQISSEEKTCFAPRCALLVSVVGTPNRGLQEFYSARKIPKCQSSSQKFLSSDFCGVPQKSRRNFWGDCHFCKPPTIIAEKSSVDLCPYI